VFGRSYDVGTVTGLQISSTGAVVTRWGWPPALTAVGVFLGVAFGADLALLALTTVTTEELEASVLRAQWSAVAGTLDYRHSHLPTW
jgi:hypothetical protein